MNSYPPYGQEDDFAPLDYSYVSSVSEGRKLEQQQKIHREKAAPLVTRRAEPDYGIPDDPFNPPAESQQPVRRRAGRTAETMQQAQPAFAEPVQTAQPIQPTPPRPAAPIGPQFDPPARVDMPDWLRVAQQNNMPLRRPETPRVQTAPRREETDVLGRPVHRRAAVNPVSPYEAAGYPEELLQAQRQWEAEQAARPVRRRHGAQYAVRPEYAQQPPVQQAAPSQTSYPPPREAVQQETYAQPSRMRRGYHEPAPVQPDEGWHVETDEDDERPRRELPAWMTKVPWLGIGAFLAALVAIILWVMSFSFEKQTELLFAAREAQQLAIEEAHPLKYEELIVQKSNKYNLSPAFVAAIVLNESSFRPDATAASTGARGLMQLMDDTAEWIHGKLELDTPYHFDDMYTPEWNVEYGCWYLNYLSEQFRGDPVLVAAAYHAGQTNVKNWLNTSSHSPDGLTLQIQDIPFADTRRYVTRVMDNFAAYKRLYYGG